MSSSSPAFAFPEIPEPLVLAAARALAARIADGEAIARAKLNKVLAAHFGGSDAEGRWSVRDAHAAVELAQVLWLRDAAKLTPRSPVDAATNGVRPVGGFGAEPDGTQR